MRALVFWRLAGAASSAATWVLMPVAMALIWAAQHARNAHAHAELQALYAQIRRKAGRTTGSRR